MSTRRDAVAELPPSAKLVYTALEHEGGMTQGQLASETMLPPRTVRDALARLEAVGVVEQQIFIPDARKSTYTLVDEPRADA